MNKSNSVKIETIQIDNPDAKNLIFGQSHFIKTIEDLYETIVSAVPGAQFGIAFSEASGPRLIRSEGTSPKMIDLAVNNLVKVGCGHTFIIFLDNLFPVNILNSIKMVPEVARIFCATANPVSVIVARDNDNNGGVLGVIDGSSPLGIETEADKKQRKEFLREIGYKLH